MRRLIVELDVGEIEKYMDGVNLDKLELMEVLSFLNEDPRTRLLPKYRESLKEKLIL